MTTTFFDAFTGDCLEVMKDIEDDFFDLTFTSPPYENARLYGELGYKIKGQDWVDWSVERYMECVRITKGLVCWVVEGRTSKFQWSATPALLMADLHRRGVKLRKPPIFHRVGIPGSGGPDWWRNDYEFVVCSSKGKLPWSDNTANGEPCKYGPGGEMSHRMTNGRRVNGKMVYKRTTTRGYEGGDAATKVIDYSPPAKANPGNVVKCSVGGGKMGSLRAHENEAPFPESLATPFIQCFCPPGGLVFDPFCGSGTTLASALKLGRSAVGVDVREDQVALTIERIEEEVINA